MERQEVLELVPGWTMKVDRGPDWLFITLHEPQDGNVGGTVLADQLWSLLRQHFTNRLVLELDELTILRSDFISQLIRVQHNIDRDGGLLRLCGLSENNQKALRTVRVCDRFAQYRNREDAVMGIRSLQPR